MNLTKPIIWLVILIAILAAVIAFSGNSANRQIQSQTAPSSGSTVSQEHNGVRVPPPQPPATAADTVTAQQGHGFQLLVSYVNSGFEPRTAVIHAGDTVRFTNNSTGELWVAASGNELYPGVENGCGSSALDSCQPLEPGQYWQFTFTQSGTWEFVNNLDKSSAGTITVQVE